MLKICLTPLELWLKEQTEGSDPVSNISDLMAQVGNKERELSELKLALKLAEWSDVVNKAIDNLVAINLSEPRKAMEQLELVHRATHSLRCSIRYDLDAGRYDDE